MAQGTYTTELEDTDLDEEFDAEETETVDLDGDVDTWMAEMLAGPSRYEY